MNQSADYISWIRRQVGTRKIFLVFATIIVTDPEGRVLLQRRRDFQRWGLPGGALEWDEDIRQCARRELAEETGLQVGQLQLVGIYTEPEFDVTYPNGDEVQQFTICLHGQMNGGGLQDDPQETEGHAFLPLPAIDGLDLLPWYRVMLHDFARGVMPVFRPPVQAADTVDQIGRAPCRERV